MTEVLLERLTDASILAPLLGFAVGAALSLPPVSLPALTVSVAPLAPGQMDASGSVSTCPYAARSSFWWRTSWEWTGCSRLPATQS